ncbi:MAG: hypothetical protein U1F52_06440 [Burkholderiales bacterium]
MTNKNIAAWLLGAWVLILLSGAALADEWQTLPADGDGSVYLDRGSIARHGNEIDAKVLVNYSSVQTIGDDAFPHRTRVLRYGLSCATGEVRLAGWTFTSGELGSGAVVWSGPSVAHVAETPNAGSLESTLLKTLCAPDRLSRLDR